MPKKPSEPLTTKQERFVTEYLKGEGTAKDAAVRAGYAESGARVAACRMLKDPRIKSRVVAQKEKIVEKIGLNPDFVVRKWQRMIEVLSQEVEAKTVSGEPIFGTNGEPATKYIEPHALRNVLKDAADYLHMLDKKDEDTKTERVTGVLKVAATMSKDEWVKK